MAIPRAAGLWRYLLVLALSLSPVCGFAADAPSLEERFRKLEDTGGLTLEQQTAELKALKALLPAEDGALLRRHQRLECWIGFPNKFKEGLAYAEARLVEAEQAGDEDAKVDLRLCRGSHREQLGETKAAEADYQAALKLAQSSGNRRLQADAFGSLGNLHSLRGELGQAIQELQSAQRLYEAVELHYWSQNNLASIASAYRRLGDYDKALEYDRQLLTEYQEAGDELGAAAMHREIGFVLEEKGLYADALAQFRKAISIFSGKGEVLVADYTHLDTARSLVRLGRFEEALSDLVKARARREADDPVSEALANLVEGEALVGLKRYDEGLAALDKAEPVFQREDNARRISWVREARVKALAGKGEWQAAYEEALRFYKTHKALDVLMRERESARLRIEFDSARKEMENKRLLAERALKDQELQSLDEVRRWQRAVLALASALLLLLVVLGVRQIRKAQRLQVLAMTDALTELPNRRHINMVGDEAIKSAQADRRPVCILVFDVDFFKRINDGFGHGVGDEVLARVAKASQAALRQQDRLGRTGGEEFLVVLPQTGLGQAAHVAERLRASVAAVDLSDVAEGLSVTISIGVAEFKTEDTDLRALTQRADTALYRAKASGRNRVELEI